MYNNLQFDIDVQYSYWYNTMTVKTSFIDSIVVICTMGIEVQMMMKTKNNLFTNCDDKLKKIVTIQNKP